ncbi:aldolase [Aureococcus anophagefferens]|nr:aldolase [Aureococcus anophagefferens]
MAFVHGSKVARAASRVASRSIYTKTVDNYESVLDRFARDRSPPCCARPRVRTAAPSSETRAPRIPRVFRQPFRDESARIPPTRAPRSRGRAEAMAAAIDGGFKIAEFTLTTPGCLDAVADFRGKYDGDAMVVGNAAKAGPFVRKPTGFQLAKL